MLGPRAAEGVESEKRACDAGNLSSSYYANSRRSTDRQVILDFLLGGSSFSHSGRYHDGSRQGGLREPLEYCRADATFRLLLAARA